MPSTIFSGTKVKALKSIFTLNGEIDFISGTQDPTISATDAPKGSILLNTSSGFWYRKLDSGSSTNWQVVQTNIAGSATQLTNLGIDSSVAANALTISLKDGAGSDPSGGSPVVVGFRKATASDGSFDSVTISSALSVVIPSGTTIGTASGKLEPIFVYLFNDSGTPKLAVSLKLFDEGFTQSASAISGGSSASTIYATGSITSKSMRLIGVVYSSQATAGTWASAPSQENIIRTPKYTFGSVQRFTGSGTWTRPEGCVAINVKVWGGGGGGGGALGTAANAACGGGGGAGEYSESFLTNGFGSTETVTIGAAGTAGANTGGDGGSGGQSSFGTIVIANGGTGGTGDAVPGTSAGGQSIGAAGGTGGTGQLKISGGPGFISFRFSGSNAVSGAGGQSPGGGGAGGFARTGNAAGNAGIVPGGGGSGASTNSATDQAGGTGATGLCIVEEFY